MTRADAALDKSDGAEDEVATVGDPATPEWGEHAPKGAKTVLSRILKDGANVPLFLGQTLVNSLRDTGYNNTTTAVCEHVDNAIESGAKEIRVYFAETGPKSRRSIDVVVLDDGRGMSPNVLKVASAFGGSMRFDNRRGIGRYGMGMKAAALSMTPEFDIYSWQEPQAFYNLTLDVAAIGQDKGNVIMVPDPQMVGSLPAEITLTLTTPMAYPKNPGELQDVLCRDATELPERLGTHGTIIFMKNCDRLTFRKVRTLVDNATREMARVYRRHLDRGLKLYVNNRLVEAFDPTYQIKSARHHRLPELDRRETTSRLVNRWVLDAPEAEGSDITHPIAIRLYFMPIADWSGLPRKVLKNDLKIYENHGISFMRGDREVDIKLMEGIVGRRSTRDPWWRMEVDFSADLDEAFGVAMNKQGVRPKQYLQALIREAILEDFREVRRAIEQHWSERATRETKSLVMEAEQRANETEAFQATILPQPVASTEHEQRVLDDNLKNLAIGLKRDGESDEEAFARVKSSRFVTTFKHDADAAFYRVDYQLGKVILTINTAHPFFKRIYEPMSAVAKQVTETSAPDDGEDCIDASLADECSQVLVRLQLFLLSLGRTQSEMTIADGELHKVFDKLRRQWSLNLETQLTRA